MINAALVVSFAIQLWVTYYVTWNGLDLREKSSWLYGLISGICGLIAGLAIVFYLGNVNTRDLLAVSLGVSFLFTFSTMVSGVVMRYHQKNSKVRDNSIKTLYRSLKKKKNKNYFANLAEKLLEKFI